MKLEVVSTINGRKATRAKAWRVCETGVTYEPPYTSRTPRRVKAGVIPRLHPDERAVLDALRACGTATLMQIRESVPARPSPQEMARILARLTALGLVTARGKNNGSIAYEATS